jgi:hypothetical protein
MLLPDSYSLTTCNLNASLYLFTFFVILISRFRLLNSFLSVNIYQDDTW